MRKKELPKYRELVSLIPGGTIQFLDIALDLTRLPRLKTEYWEWEDRPGSGGDLSAWHLMCLKSDERSGGYVDELTGLEAVEPSQLSPGSGTGKLVTPSYSINAEKSLEPFLDQWVPLPFLRKEIMAGAQHAGFRKGPSDWVRVMVARDPAAGAEGTYLATLAFDTVVERPFDPEDDGIFPALRLDDVRDGAEFSLVHEVKHNSWFIAQEWVADWLNDLFLQAFRKKNRGRPVHDLDRENRMEHIARYVSFLELLNVSGVVPSVRVVDPARNEAIDVDLVLDIGNSRTTGMLIERRDSDSMGLSNSVVLELRDLSQPGLMHNEPFGSNIAFVRQKFGDPNGFSRGSGRRQRALQWPSVVRVGPEASRVALRSRRDEGQTTMSSPKRYLWDRAKRTQEWRYCPDSFDGNAEEPPVNSGAFVGFVNNFGTPLHALDDPRVMREFRTQDRYPATEPMFSRSSMMMFLLSEVVAHALAQINSPAQRGERLNPDLARRLRNIILTVPPAMTIAERQMFERWANWTVETLWKTLDWSENATAGCFFSYQQPPRIRCQWDEASTTQMVYVYNEVAEKFAGDATAYFEAFGRRRADRGARSSFRVASIDIGGGTTDLIVTTYLDDSSGATAILEPVQEFREGFNLAGDDILKAVIERHVLGALVSELERAGFRDPADYLTRKVGKDVTGLSERDKNLRAQFAQQYAVPVGLHIMRLSEHIAMREANGSVQAVRFDDVFGQISKPRAEVLTFIEGEISKSIDGFSLEKWEIAVDFADVAATIDSVVAPVLGDLCEAVAAWDCDVLLLSGRPSCLPAVQAVILRRPPVPLSRIVPMSAYRVEGWYPFWSPGGLIADPKTTGVVGAMLCALSEGDLLNFHCNTSKLRPASTVKYVGQMLLTGQIMEKDLFFSGIDLDASAADEQRAEFSFAAPMFIGFRQLPLERWKATPFYFLSFASQNAKDEARKRGVPYKVSLVYQRRAVPMGGSGTEDVYDEGAFKIEEIVAADGSNVRPTDLLLELKTLRDENGYWLDTGLFHVQ